MSYFPYDRKKGTHLMQEKQKGQRNLSSEYNFKELPLYTKLNESNIFPKIDTKF
jgi:hypothetical protein